MCQSIFLLIVFYHGTTAWNIPISFVDKFEVSKEIKENLLDFTYLLFDTKDLNIEEKKYQKLTENIKLTAQILLMKNIFEKEIVKLEEVLKFWYKNGLVKDKDFLEKSLTYIMFTNDYSQDEIIELLEKNKIGGEQMPNLGQRLIDKGRDQGIQQGIQKGMLKGRQEGMQEGKTELILNMLNQGIKVEDVSKFTGLPIEEIKLIIDKAN